MKTSLQLLFGIFFTLLISSVSAQSYDHCATMQNLDYHHQNNPRLADQMDQVEATARQWLDQNRDLAGGGVITIPTVVHIVYIDPDQNLSDAQIFSQMDVLNADFRRLNADTSLTRPEFDSLAADFEVEFCLATTDPQGNSTTGITRTQSQGGQLFGWFGPLDDVKSSTTGGVDPWPTDQYLNIWVCNLLPIIAGYAQFPGDDPATDGVVIGYNFFGTTGTVTPPYNKGRTTTHEVGHWLGLRHVWGDGDCTMDDFVADTPGADANNSGGCLNVKNSCTDSPYDYDDMVENYMDYSNDSCMNMFSLGQKARGWSFLNTDRISLFSSNGCSLAVATPEAIIPQDPFVLYPNPAEEKVSVTWTGDATLDVQFQVYNAMGQAVVDKKMSAGEIKSEIDLSALPAGTYFVTSTAAGVRYTKKLSVN